MGRATIKTPERSNHDKIKSRVMELFETVDDLKKLFRSILPKNSLLKSILKIDEKHDKEEVCDIVLSYLGDNFFVYVGKVRSDEVDFEGEIITTAIYKKMKQELEHRESLTSKQYEKYTIKVEEYEKSLKINPAHIVREKFLEQICIFNNDNSDKKRQDIIDSFNQKQKDKNKIKTLKELSQSRKFLIGPWAKYLCNKVLLLPHIIVEKPETEPQLPETIALQKNSHLPRLYDFQTEALIRIHNMFNNTEDLDGRQKRLLINLPTGAGKTRMTVQAIIEWLNLREDGKCENAHEQQKNPNGLIFWLASTNELCTQASDSFQQLFSHIGTAGQINLTNWYGNNRRALRNIRDDKPGTHIVVTNTIHTNKNFKQFENKDAGSYRFDWYKDSPELIELRKNTIAIVIDEAHEVPSKGYQNFLAAMGFDLNKNKRGLDKKIYNTKNIVLIGLTATPYKGSGISYWFKCTKCSQTFENQVLKNNHTKKYSGHSDFKTIEPVYDDEFDDDLGDDENEPNYYKTLDPITRKIHKTFGGVFLPIPHKSVLDSAPIVIIDVPLAAHVGDSIKISGRNSYDQYSELDFLWEIATFEKIIYKSKINPERKSDEPEFYQKFMDEGDYSIRLTVINAKNISSYTEQKIKILPKEKSGIKRRGDLSDTKEFYDILTNDQKILCKITHGVIVGPHTKLSRSELRKWKMGTLDNEDGEVSNNEVYNTKICNAVDKCIKDYGKKRVLLFANGVKHSQELMLIFRIKYGYTKAESVDSKTNPGIRRRIIKEFREGKIPILCNFGVLTTGFDVPKIDTVVIARDVGSNALYTQMIGRGQRGLKPGGTDELWLITSNFPHQTDSPIDLKLGWEALAENWQKFSKEQQENLGLTDAPITKSSSEEPKPEFKKNNLILNMDPIEDLKLKCQTCGIITQGLKNNLESYGYKSDKVDEKTFKETVEKFLKNNKFHKNCLFCQKVIDEAEQSKCEFTKYIAKNHELDPIFILIVNFIYKYQTKNKFMTNWEIIKNDLKNNLSKQEISYDFITHNMPVMQKLVNDKIIEIKPNLDVEFTKIDNLDTSKKIINQLQNNINLQNKLQNIYDKYKKNEVLKINKQHNDFDAFYYECKNTLNHIPTKRQFTLNLDEKLKTQFKKLYNSDYEKFLSFKREILKDDGNLKDLLYEEYFQKCIREKSKITHKELDETGDYRLEDYKDMWITVEKFEKRVEPILNDVLKYYDDFHNKRDSEFEAISKDIQELKKKRPSDFYHFETIYQHSKVRVFRYVIQLRISSLRYLQNYNGQNHGVFLQLISDFFRLKKWIQTTPTRDEFMKLTGPLSTGNLMKEFGFKNNDYERFLEMISITLDSRSPEHQEITKEIIIDELKKYCNKYGKDKTLLLIALPFNPNDRLSVQIQMYFPDIKKLKKLLYPINSNTDA